VRKADHQKKGRRGMAAMHQTILSYIIYNIFSRWCRFHATRAERSAVEAMLGSSVIVPSGANPFRLKVRSECQGKRVSFTRLNN